MRDVVVAVVVLVAIVREVTAVVMPEKVARKAVLPESTTLLSVVASAVAVVLPLLRPRRAKKAMWLSAGCHCMHDTNMDHGI